jgi:hypothetical protein
VLSVILVFVYVSGLGDKNVNMPTIHLCGIVKHIYHLNIETLSNKTSVLKRDSGEALFGKQPRSLSL